MKTRALLESWHVLVTIRPRDGILGLSRDVTESIARHRHPTTTSRTKCGECCAVAWSPYHVTEFEPGPTAERLAVAWISEEDSYARNTTHTRKLLWFFGPDRFVDLAYAISREYGVGPFSEGDEPPRVEAAGASGWTGRGERRASG